MNRVADIIRGEIQEIICDDIDPDEKMEQIGKWFALYGYYAQQAGKIAILQEKILELERKK